MSKEQSREEAKQFFCDCTETMSSVPDRTMNWKRRVLAGG